MKNKGIVVKRVALSATFLRIEFTRTKASLPDVQKRMQLSFPDLRLNTSGAIGKHIVSYKLN